MESANKDILTIRKASEINLSSIIKNPDNKSFLITSANAKSGVTSSTLSLAHELSRTTDGRTLVIDTSLNTNNLTSLLKLNDSLGLIDLDIHTESSIEKYCHKINSFEFYFMPLGVKKNNIKNIIHQDLKEILEKLSNVFRYIVIDGDAIYSNNNTIEIAAKADAVILVVQAEETRWEVAQAAQSRLSQAGANIIGCVFNNRKYYTPNWIYNKL
jgi:MinD-like ATPase involved in chromosome partitioning or flagellar assembly